MNARPRASELVSLAERMGSLGALRFGFVVVALAFGLLSDETLGISPAELTGVSTSQRGWWPPLRFSTTVRPKEVQRSGMR
jgi:hypothetical protein